MGYNGKRKRLDKAMDNEVYPVVNKMLSDIVLICVKRPLGSLRVMLKSADLFYAKQPMMLSKVLGASGSVFGGHDISTPRVARPLGMNV